MTKDRPLGRLALCGSGMGSPSAYSPMSGALLLISVLLTSAGGCAKPDRAAIQSADPNERILGIFATATANDTLAVPLLVDRLEDEDEAVRFYAIIALDKITGQRLGYDYAKPAGARAPAVARWRQFVREGGHVGQAKTKDSGMAEGDSPAPTAGTRRTVP